MNNADYYHNVDFQEKVKFYVIKAAIAIMAEAASVDHHTERVAYAVKVLNDTSSIPMYSLGVSVNATVKAHIDAGTSYDSDLEFVVNSLFTAYAGGAA